ncbi:MAG: hypothetical protein QN173_03770 [Armatimonadota bacterium]|nr:hypothetical protein [Armatimonadota bacterium]MDR7402897.1 hypothetical protein [Armatimonadota bacterium]MDR7404795.1 hypothetical protein [Armatimonadota bacterium]MDR7436132.1 hypothetical protein [Armatimonadota bacterium]MDR7472011.1 hypothetical protein [Armatimonadota bacterium]
MTPQVPFTSEERRVLAGIVRQVWRAFQVYVTVAVERGPASARPALEELARWAAARRRELASRAPALSPAALRAGRDLLDDVESVSRQVLAMVAAASASAPPEQAEERLLGIVEGVLGWTGLMASQLGLARHLRPSTLWHER